MIVKAIEEKQMVECELAPRARMTLTSLCVLSELDGIPARTCR